MRVRAVLDAPISVTGEAEVKGEVTVTHRVVPDSAFFRLEQDVRETNAAVRGMARFANPSGPGSTGWSMPEAAPAPREP